ncbi:hypothetical protein [Chryseobacterium sp. POE27]|uniref:hypothetical protein n=1 Tax=Chryseobacterium sp. POE27 TaxID=3138177 RepID=UPI00321B7BFF
MIYKIFWALRALLYAPFFGKFGFPSYLGKPIFLMGTRNVFIGKKSKDISPPQNGSASKGKYSYTR